MNHADALRRRAISVDDFASEEFTRLTLESGKAA